MGLLDFLTGGSPRDRFAKAVMARIRARGWAGPIDYDAETFSLALGKGGVQLEDAFLDRPKMSRARQAEVLEELVTLALMSADPPPATLAEAAEKLLPVIRKRAHVGDVWLVLPSWEEAAHRLSHAPISESLCALAAIEANIGMRVIDDEQLTRWGVGFDEVMAIAVENLQSRSAPAKFERDPRGFYTANYRDHYDASRLLLPELLQTLPLKGDPVAIVPERDTLAVAGSEDEGALEAMGAQLESVIPQLTRLISPEPLVWRDGAWRPLAHSDASRPIGRLAVIGRLIDARWQAAALEEQLSFDGRAARPAELQPLEGSSRPATWSRIDFGGAVLAPLADAYVLVAPKPSGALVRARADFEAVCGPFAREPDCWPERLVIDRAPTEAQWAQLRAAAVPEGFDALQSEATSALS